MRRQRIKLDGDGLTRLFEIHAQELLAFFARRTFDPQVAFDLLGETFATAFEQRATCRAREASAQRAWLFGIGRNLLSDFYRDGQIERRAMARIAADAVALSDASYERIEQLADLRGVRLQIASALRELSAEHREALLLRVIEERSYREVATEMAVTEQVARARVSRALRGLRDAIDLTDAQAKGAYEHV